MHANNEKLEIYKNHMPKHNVGIVFAQGNAAKSSTIAGAPWGKNQNEASTSRAKWPFESIIW